MAPGKNVLKKQALQNEGKMRNTRKCFKDTVSLLLGGSVTRNFRLTVYVVENQF